MGDTLHAPMSRKAMRKAKKGQAKALALAQKAAAEEAVEEAALQAAVEAAQRANLKTTTTTTTNSDTRTKKDEDPSKANVTEKPQDAIPAVVATITVTRADTTSEKPKGDSAVAPPRSKNARRRMRRRQSRKNKSAPAQQRVEQERAPQRQVEPSPETASNVWFRELLQNSMLDWVERKAYRVYRETTTDGRKASFVYDRELVPYQKLCSAIESLDLSLLEKDNGAHSATKLDCHIHWGWLPRLSDGNLYVFRLCYHQYSEHLQPIACYQIQCRGVDGSKYGDFYTFMGDGTPICQHIEYCEYQDIKRPHFESPLQEQRFDEEDKQQLIKAKSFKKGPDGNLLSQSLSSLEESGFVYRGKPREVQRVVYAYCGDSDGQEVWVAAYSSTFLAYKSYYRVASNSTRDMYYYGGEHYFYPSGRRCMAYDWPTGLGTMAECFKAK